MNLLQKRPSERVVQCIVICIGRQIRVDSFHQNEFLMMVEVMLKTLSLLLLSFNLYAWTPEQHKMASTFRASDDDAFVATIRGTCKQPNIKWSRRTGKLSTEEIDNQWVKKGKIDYRSLLLKSGRGGFKQAPLIFYVPGVFSEFKRDGWVDLRLKQFAKTGHHAMALPNPVSLDYLKLKPKHRLLDIEKEALSYYQTMRKIYAQHKKNNILKQDESGQPEVRLVGVSYGSFIASIITYLDSKHEEPIFTKPVTIISPPYNIYSALKNLDKYIDDVNMPYDEMTYYGLGYEVSGVCNTDTKEQADKNIKHLAKVAVVHLGFKRPLVEIAKQYEDNGAKIDIPYRANLLAYRSWHRDLRFFSFDDQQHQDIFEQLRGSKGTTLYWLNKAENQGGVAYRILTTDNDFLNRQHRWDEVDKARIIRFKKGGHFGYRSSNWLQKFFELIF